MLVIGIWLPATGSWQKHINLILLPLIKAFLASRRLPAAFIVTQTSN
ncbi:MAG: hypothetical protein H7X84_10820 [Verrucomicrobia bacterium]|nr:hypothetical protein [Prolixibacteraceae bacterium]